MNSFPDRLEEIIDAANSLTGTQKTVYVVCRRGNDSQLATQMLLDKGMKNVFDIRGGLTSWHYEVDPEFPLY